MTLVLTAATPFYVVQCADRLLTIAGERPRAFDPAANKTMLYRASDAVAVISYAGLAYAGDKPTDEILAETLWGEPMRPGPDGMRLANRVGRRPNRWNLGQAERALEAALASPLFAAHYIGLTIGGWRQRKGRIAPFVTEIERKPGQPPAVARSPRVFTRDANFFLHGIGVDFDASDTMRALRREEKGLRIGPSAEATRNALVRAIQTIAAQDDRVGADVLSVVLAHPRMGAGEVAFHAARAWPARISSPYARFEAPHADHTPWIVAPNAISPPSAQVGDTIHELGGYEVFVRGAKPNGRLLGIQTSLKRPRAPNARGRR